MRGVGVWVCGCVRGEGGREGVCGEWACGCVRRGWERGCVWGVGVWVCEGSVWESGCVMGSKGERVCEGSERKICNRQVCVCVMKCVYVCVFVQKIQCLIEIHNVPPSLAKTSH